MSESKCPFGMVEVKPLIGWPAGQLRVRRRPDDFVKVFLRDDQGIQAWIPTEKNGAWFPKHLIAENYRAQA